MSKWEKLGLVFKARGQKDWMQTYTSMPSPLHLKDDLYRIYFSTRCINQIARVGYIEIDLKSPSNVLSISETPVFDVGAPGRFDDSGVYFGNILQSHDGMMQTYYSARNNGKGKIYYMSIGLAEKSPFMDQFYRRYEYPIISRNEVNPWMVSTPWVVKKREKYYLYYMSGIKYSLDLTSSYYDIKMATSNDGKNWIFNPKSIISLSPNETNIAAPSIVSWEDKYLMFFSYVRSSKKYAIGQATSLDLLNWERLDDPVGLNYGPNDWDSLCMAYPHLFIHNNELYLLYSGNENGKDGMGLAKYKYS